MDISDKIMLIGCAYAALLSSMSAKKGCFMWGIITVSFIILHRLSGDVWHMRCSWIGAAAIIWTACGWYQDEKERAEEYSDDEWGIL